MNKMNLAQIQLCWINSYPRAMFNCFSGVRITFNAEACKQSNGIGVQLGE